MMESLIEREKVNRRSSSALRGGGKKEGYDPTIEKRRENENSLRREKRK